ncbi:MAG: hypothetical protein LBU48_01820 [Coriobacteriales bacterium]|nr:hypothetical protein [Coriobacteriales bacterium]
MIDQVTVFLENETGRLASLCRTLGEAGISMQALTIADTADYGVVRIIADNPQKALETLQNAGFRASLTPVFAVSIPDHAGGLARLLDAFDAAAINLEYAYCFSSIDGNAVDVLRIENNAAAPDIITAAGFRLLEQHELHV